MKIFVEYQVNVDHLADFYTYAQELKGLYPRVRVYEGVRQPGLYVEEWEDYSEAFFEELRDERAQLHHPFWSQLDEIVVGGRNKVNIWLFHEI